LCRLEIRADCPIDFVTTTPGPSFYPRRGVPLLAEEGLGVAVANDGSNAWHSE
jgi:hypothetical protein